MSRHYCCCYYDYTVILRDCFLYAHTVSSLCLPISKTVISIPEDFSVYKSSSLIIHNLTADELATANKVAIAQP